MTDTAPTGLDRLVEEAMQRKIVPTQQEAAVFPTPSPAAPAEELGPDAQIDLAPKSEKSSLSAEPEVGPAPDTSLAFMVNGVKVLVTIHVEPGATVTLPGSTASAKPRSGPKVKGVRGRTTEPTEPVSVAPEVAEAAVTSYDETKPTSDDNLPEGWGLDPVVGATPGGWKCPDHGKAVVKTSTVSGRTYVKCPEEGCNQLAPK